MKQLEETKLKIFEELSDVFPSLIPLEGKKPIEKEWTLYCEESRFFNASDFKGHNCGIVCGPSNGIIVLDIDNEDSFGLIRQKNGWELPQTRVHETGNEGLHYFYKYPQNGKRYGNKSFKNHGFDIRGIGGQVVGPGSIHPVSGKQYTIFHDVPIAPAPQWLLDLSLQKPEQAMIPQQAGTPNDTSIDIESLPVSYSIKNLIKNGVKKGNRSEAQASVLSAFIRAKVSDSTIFQIFNAYPIGEKFHEKGNSKDKWLQDEINRVKGFTERNGAKTGNVDVAARVREYLLDGFDGGVFKVGDLKRELGLNDKSYTVARNCVKRMTQQGLIQKHGHQMGCYRVVDKRKDAIVWDKIEAKPSGLLLPCGLHSIVVTRYGDMVCFAGYKNHNKTAMAIETVRLNLDKFKIHFFITEYAARMKRRLMDFGIDLNHPNLKCYQIDRSDYIPDKITPGEGVLNVIDHFPNLDNFYLVGKYQDEIHRNLDGALCLITHQKKNPDDLDAIGGSFWTITPTLAVTLLPYGEHGHMMKIRKGKEPAGGIFNAYGKSIKYILNRGCKLEADKKGWK